MKYLPVVFESEAAAEAALARNEPEELRLVPIAASLYAERRVWAEALCLRLASHPHPDVRGNAIQGFGHLARRFGRLDRRTVEPVVTAALADPTPFVRDNAEFAAADIARFLGWRPNGEA